ncbi:hypothetical protein [Acidisphaera sp. S103]|uniref:hypothetical protein n=1 Tax=Acidisphaera sp. S103 TaxID=1747223 RepID=UPI00131AFC42|nr:hypothetical protein [Acidisphaera sp. S103]
MRRKRPSSSAGTPNRAPRRRDVDLPAVPVFRIDSLPGTTPQPAETEDHPADEAVRRMVEAAYT